MPPPVPAPLLHLASPALLATLQPLQVVARTKAVISYGDEEIDLCAVEQIAEKSQTRAIADSISWLSRMLKQRGPGSSITLSEAVASLEAAFDEQVKACLLLCLHRSPATVQCPTL